MERELVNTLRTDLLTFGAMALREDGLSIEHQLYLQRIAHVLTGVHKRQINRLVLRAPPRHLKTKMCACFIAFELGHYPGTEVIWMSYDDSTAAMSVDYIREILRLPWFAQVFPETVLSSDHNRSGDFRTTRGGGVRAIGIHGKVTAKGADIFIGDDVLDQADWNNYDEIEKVIASLDRVIPSRFNNPASGRAVLLGHCLNVNDPGSHFINKGWRAEDLPFEAVRDEDIELGHAIWHRKRGELLQPAAYTPEIVEDLRKRTDPPYGRLYQQGVSESPTLIKGSDFRMCERGRHGNEPIVLSVDTALRSGPNHSFNVIQAWAFDGTNHFLREQFRQQCNYETLESRFCAMVAKLRPYAAIIEETANGPALIQCAEKLGISVVAVKPKGSKADRLAAHGAIIKTGRVHVARHLYGELVDEVDNRPRNGTDQIDTLSQALTNRPKAPPMERRQQSVGPHLARGSYMPRGGAGGTTKGIATANFSNRIANLEPPLGCGWGRLRSSSIG